MEGHATISTEVLGSYAADAAREVDGVRGLVESALHRQRGVRVDERDGVVSLELEVALERGANVAGGGAPCKNASPPTSSGWQTCDRPP